MNPDDRAGFSYIMAAALASVMMVDPLQGYLIRDNRPRGKGKVAGPPLPDPVVRRDYAADQAKERAKAKKIAKHRKIGGRP